MTEPTHAFVWRAFSLPKDGHEAGEYEDAFAGDPLLGRFAIADGATESSFAGAWAQLLVSGYVEHEGPWANWLPAARDRWQGAHQSEALSWYAEAKAEEGAFATLLGVRFAVREGRGFAWQARAVGDSCLFHVRGRKLHRAFPLKRAADFSNQPVLIGSTASRVYSWTAGHRRTWGRWLPQDRLLLMTDALAQWFLHAVEAGKKPWRKLQDLTSTAEFTAFVAKLRRQKKIRNDDVTLVCIEASTNDQR